MHPPPRRLMGKSDPFLLDLCSFMLLISCAVFCRWSTIHTYISPLVAQAWVHAIFFLGQTKWNGMVCGRGVGNKFTKRE